MSPGKENESELMHDIGVGHVEVVFQVCGWEAAKLQCGSVNGIQWEGGIFAENNDSQSIGQPLAQRPTEPDTQDARVKIRPTGGFTRNCFGIDTAQEPHSSISPTCSSPICCTKTSDTAVDAARS